MEFYHGVKIKYIDEKPDHYWSNSSTSYSIHDHHE